MINVPTNYHASLLPIREDVVQRICNAFLGRSLLYLSSEKNNENRTVHIGRFKCGRDVFMSKERSFRPLEDVVRIYKSEVRTAFNILRGHGWFFHKYPSVNGLVGYGVSGIPHTAIGTRINKIIIDDSFDCQ